LHIKTDVEAVPGQFKANLPAIVEPAGAQEVPARRSHHGPGNTVVPKYKEEAPMERVVNAEREGYEPSMTTRGMVFGSKPGYGCLGKNPIPNRRKNEHKNHQSTAHS